MTRRASYNVNSGVDFGESNEVKFQDGTLPTSNAPVEPQKDRRKKCAKIVLGILLFLFIVGLILLLLFIPWKHSERENRLEGEAESERPTVPLNWVTTEAGWGRKASIVPEKSDPYNTTESDPYNAVESDATAGSDVTDADNSTIVATEQTIPPIPPTTPRPKCVTPICYEIANWSLSLLDQSVSPCQDFYSFACGPRHKSRNSLQELSLRLQEIIEDELMDINSDFPKSQQSFNNYYENCLEYKPPAPDSTEGKSMYEDILSKLDRFGNFQMADEWEQDPITITRLLSQLMLAHSTPLFDILLDVNGMAPNTFIFKLTFPHFPPIIPNDNYRCNPSLDESGDIKMHNIIDGYISCTKDIDIILRQVVEALNHFKVFYHLSEYNRTQMYQDISVVLELSVLPQIYQERPSEATLRRHILSKNYKLMNTTQLVDKFPMIDWYEFFKALTSKPPADDENIQVYFEKYFEGLFAELKTIEAWRLHNAVLALYLREQYMTFIVVPPLFSPTNYCYHVTTSLMPEIAASIVLLQLRESSTKLKNDADTVSDYIYRVNKTLIDFIKNSNLPIEYSQSFEDKLKYLRPIIGNFGQAPDEAKLYSAIEAIDGIKGFYPATQYLLERFRDRLYKVKSLNTWTMKAIWSHFSDPIQTQAVNLYSNNMIIIPLGMMTKPLYFAEYPPYISLAGLGVILAHEIAHNFDSVGQYYSPKGFLLTNSSLLEHGTKIRSLQECLVSSCGSAHEEMLNPTSVLSYELPVENKKDEMLADFLGLHVTYQTAKNHKYFLPYLELPGLDMTVEQIFFMRFAQMHCTNDSLASDVFNSIQTEYLPNHLRVNTALQHMPDFGEAFSCTRGDPMMPTTNCYASLFQESP